MKHWLRLALGAALCLGMVIPTDAGNIALTGHDDDFHFASGNPAAMQLAALIAFAKAGSATPTLPILTFDAGSELTSDLTTLGIAFTNVNPDTSGAVTASLFNASIYSAFVVASDSSCGGCDNDSTGEANIAAQAAAVASFFNSGGGIVGLAGAGNASTYYNFLPASAAGFGSPPSSGYVQTSFGASIGVPAVNGNATHNFFFDPGTSGVSAAYGIAEVLPGDTPTAETIACAGCVIGGGEITPGGPAATPEPSSLMLLGSGLVALLIASKRKLLNRA
jgi:PEP-CTERM motif